MQRLVAVVYEPVSEAGRAGVEELETQTSQLLSFQSVGNRVFGTQAAFNMLPRFGSASRVVLQEKLLELRAEISAAVGDAEEDAKISVNLVHAPVFYGTTFSVCADLGNAADAAALAQAVKEAGFAVVPIEEAGPSNVSVAGDTVLYLSEPRPDTARENCWWFWGAETICACLPQAASNWRSGWIHDARKGLMYFARRVGDGCVYGLRIPCGRAQSCAAKEHHRDCSAGDGKQDHHLPDRTETDRRDNS
jgi:hypothetical protein